MLIFVLLAAGLFGCAADRGKDDEAMRKKISGKVFVWQKPGFGGDFTITLKDDGTYTYYEGMLSSFISTGKWSVNNGILTLEKDDGYGLSFRFDIMNDELIFRAAESSKFIYVSVEDGDHFVLKENIIIESKAILVVEANKQFFYAEFEDNSSAAELIEKLSEEPLILEMHDYGSFEKVAELPWRLPANDQRITTQPGDVILYQGNQLTVYYAENTWTFTRIAHIADADKQMLKEALGSGDVTVRFSIQWSR
ncbi:MAG: hypothetical protein K6A14_03765 [Erysipelotrichaceae bacterium]|nr:hypothetical protein [Erysipelotrichaceae bacterium]